MKSKKYKRLNWHLIEDTILVVLCLLVVIGIVAIVHQQASKRIPPLSTAPLIDP